MSIKEGLSQASLIHVLRVDSGIGSETPCGLLDDMVLTKHRQSHTLSLSSINSWSIDGETDIENL